jgi:3-oxoacyl-[acyl-carrier-protein] synthase-3
MNAQIIASAVCDNPEIKSSIKLAAHAAKECIEAANLDVNDVDYLLNVGVYRDQNIVEPSMAALIQKELNINPDFTRYEVKSTAFSCDVMNGVNGALNACQLASAVFKNQKAKYVLIVSSDVHPSGEKVDGLPFKPVGAALLLAPSDSLAKGFTAFDMNAGTVNDDNGEVGQIDIVGFGTNGRNLMLIDRTDNYVNNLQDLLVSSANRFISEHKFDLERTALIVPALERSFCKNVGERLGFKAENIVDSWGSHQYTHSSSFTCGFNQVASLSKDIKHVVYVGAGAGLSAACAAYRI